MPSGLGGEKGGMTNNENTEMTEQPGSDVTANPQDLRFGKEAAEDLERVDRGEAPKHDGEVEPNAWGKADKA